MVAKGRTMRDARDAGTLYEVSNPKYARYGAQFPAAETPAEAAGCMAWPWPTFSKWYPAGTRFEVRRVLKGSTIGFTILGAELWTFRFERGAMIEQLAPFTCAECGYTRDDVQRSAEEISDPYCCEYVQAWVWVSNSDAGLVDDDEPEQPSGVYCGGCGEPFEDCDGCHTPVGADGMFSCAKCGARTHQDKAVEDEGYLYCSEECKERH